MSTRSYSYSVQEAKAKFSEVLRLVQDRGDAVITHHGRRIARIVRFDDFEADESLDERLERLAASGALKRASSGSSSLPAARRTSHSSGALRRFLADRE